MAYATREAFINQHGLDGVLVVADRDQDGQPDDLVIDQHLADASAEIDSYVGQRHRLPLPQVPAVLVRVCGDVAMYLLSREGTSLTEDKRKRYEDAVAYLRRVAAGEISLGLPTPPEEESSGMAFFEAQPKRFGDLL